MTNDDPFSVDFGAGNEPAWAREFRIVGVTELDFVLGESRGYVVGLSSRAPAELKRRIIAAKLSYELGLKSIDYAKKSYVAQNSYEISADTMGQRASDLINYACEQSSIQLKELHRIGTNSTYGRVGADIAVLRAIDAIRNAKILANRGYLLEPIPILRLAVEMIAWAAAAFFFDDESRLDGLKAENCIRDAKKIYKPAGRLYGYLSMFSHWRRDIHRSFLVIKENQAGVITVSCLHRAMSLSACIIVVEFLLEVIIFKYQEHAMTLYSAVQNSESLSEECATRSALREIAGCVDEIQISDIISLLE